MIDSFVFMELKPRVVVAEPGVLPGVLVQDDDSIHLRFQFAAWSVTEMSVFERLPFCVIRHGLLRRPRVAATARPIREPKMPAPVEARTFESPAPMREPTFDPAAQIPTMRDCFSPAA
jgi:hypothetical protein